MSVIKILVVPASPRPESLAGRLVSAVTRELVLANVDVTRISLADYPLPIHDGESEDRTGAPQHAVNLKRMIGVHHGVFIATPDINAAPPAVLKNAIDWVSRVRDRDDAAGEVLRSRAFALGAASEDHCGGVRALGALRQTLVQGCGATVVPAELAVPFAAQAFDELDNLREPRDAEMLRAMVRQLIAVAQQMM